MWPVSTAGPSCSQATCFLPAGSHRCCMPLALCMLSAVFRLQRQTCLFVRLLLPSRQHRVCGGRPSNQTWPSFWLSCCLRHAWLSLCGCLCSRRYRLRPLAVEATLVFRMCVHMPFAHMFHCLQGGLHGFCKRSRRALPSVLPRHVHCLAAGGLLNPA